MTKNIKTHCCDEMASHLLDEIVPIFYTPNFREYGIELYDKLGTLYIPSFLDYNIELYKLRASAQRIAFCPWCGTKLPDCLRDIWFEEIRALGFEWGDEGIPIEYHSEQWWRNKFGKE